MATEWKATELTPRSEKNLAGYGLPPLSWNRTLRRLQEEWKLQAPPEMGGVPEPHTHWLATTRPGGRPHVVPIGVVWDEGRFYFSSGAGTRKSRNLAENPHSVISLAAADLDIVLEGEARKVTDEAKLRRLAGVFASGRLGADGQGRGVPPRVQRSERWSAALAGLRIYAEDGLRLRYRRTIRRDTLAAPARNEGMNSRAG